MPKPLETTIEPASKDKDTAKDDDLSGLNSPELDPKTGKPTKRAVSSFTQAHSISKNLFRKAVDGRLQTAATVAKKYGGEAPFIYEDLVKTAQTWRNNFSTNPLASVVDRAKPQLTDPIKQTDSLSYSQLPATRENAAEKTRKFRARVTKLIRGWTAWIDFVDSIAQEDYLNGGAIPGWLNQDDWRPKAFRTDEAFMPEGSGQHASKLQMILFREPIQLHDFIKKLEDKEIATAAKYNWDGCIKAANEAGSHRNMTQESPLAESDAFRELGDAGEYDGETKVIWQFHLFVREYDGGVTLWTTAQEGGHGIREYPNIQEKMEDVTTLFTLQTGNERYYGSKGAGRLLTNVHIAIDRLRNLGCDQVYLGGLPILQCDEKLMNTVQPTVRHPFILVPTGATIAKESVKFDYKGFEYMDTMLVRNMEAIAGAFIPPKLEQGGGPNTKIEAAQRAERELAVRNGVLGRFFGNFGELISSMQRKIFSPDNLSEGKRIFEENKSKNAKGMKVIPKRIWDWLKKVSGLLDEKIAAPQETTKLADPEAVEAIVDLLTDGLTIEDITELALSPAGNNIEEQGEKLDGDTISFIEAKIQAGDPYFEQKEMRKMQAETAIGVDRAARILLKEKEDPNIEAVAIRQQTIEFAFMMDGEEMPVAITDHHSIHRKVLLERMTPIMQTMEVSPTPELFEPAKLCFTHFAQHLAMDLQVPPEQRMKEEEGLMMWQKVLEGAMKIMEKAQAEAAAKGATGPVPAPLPGQPIQAGPGGALAGTENDLDRQKLEAETLLKARKLAVDEGRLALDTKKLDLDDEHRTMQTATQSMQHVADAAAEARKEGMADANEELQAQAQQSEPKA